MQNNCLHYLQELNCMIKVTRDGNYKKNSSVFYYFRKLKQKYFFELTLKYN